ncbi:C40 family peptidase [Burkholderia oklahomensis]|uniref:C40 family peptidase n=2 Tax=Burkholderia oklahomensis TaxID=342113 RepID=UPI0005D81500|nr:C40 family peptidase [Burkholderia oklahomensis]AJX31466.1 nlpC/P60 family protein [Burkholderia oklahomensis C6786]AOI45789.1 hydrolase Nlp/P60 [Burkholderia oklahomensis C6786]KUY51235.1 hydrolase Nlp/P60 [Burkholderia oklahomensis C6786]MBI0361677.1 C40 family peptidase [Burkholderia oklahomensis]SUW55878.1 Gamma-DL-glutamyl hydrolase precursor [Burkholderia oklahomensis]
MLRLSLSVLVISLLAACSTAPQKPARSSSGMAITTPRAYAPPRGFPNFVDHSVGREEISIQAMSLVGVPYRWGGNTPDSGFDCSGLVRYVVDRAASVNLPRTTADMSSIGESVDPDGIAPGDLIFFNTSGRPHSHVGIYVGKLRFVNAPSTGGTVRLDYLTNPYWAKRFDGIRRVAAPKAKPTPFDAPTYQASRQPDAAPRAAAVAAAQSAQSTYAANAAEQPVARATAPSAPSASSAYAANANAPSSAHNATPGAAPAYAANSPAPNAAAPAATASADPYEPPPSAMSAAQRQAQAAGAASPAIASTGAGASPAAASSYAPPTGGGTAAAVAGTSPADPIDAAADAFEPPPPTARAAARQAQLAAPGSVQILRASTAPGSASTAPTGTSDDPIARFANGGY